MPQSTHHVKNEFSSGLQIEPVVTSSGILLKSWSAIPHSNHASPSSSGGGVRLSWHVHSNSENDLTIIAFQAAPVSNLQSHLVPSSDFKDKSFEFLCTEKSPLFYVNKAAVDLFYDNHQRLDELKSQITSSTTPLIVTGQALGGSVAILFTLSLLDSIGLGKNRPLCITFGSPLIGDKKLQQAISRSATWNSCFLQVVSPKDPLPRLFIKDHASAAAGTGSHTADYMPFGTFLFCSDGNSTCFESPDSILQLLQTMASVHHQNQGLQSIEYGNIVKNLYYKAICKDITARGEDMTGYSSLRASISLQLWALGLTPHMEIRQQQNSTLGGVMERQEEKFNYQKKSKFEPTKKLNLMKIQMAQLEWYKKDSKNQGIGYYDSYKKMISRQDQDVVTFHKKLTQYWEKMVEEAEMKPQKEGAAFRIRWLYGGTNYRRMVEPLDIAEYYANSGKETKSYLKERSRHYIQLEKWLSEGTTTTSGSNSASSRDVESILTFDSCFWAHVEDALLSCKVVKDDNSSATDKEDAKQKLLKFEDYVYGLLKNYDVSSEIFLNGSSYMLWWREYKAILGTSHNSELASFMSNAVNYNERYVRGTYNFS